MAIMMNERRMYQMMNFCKSIFFSSFYEYKYGFGIRNTANKTTSMPPTIFIFLPEDRDREEEKEEGDEES